MALRVDNSQILIIRLFDKGLKLHREFTQWLLGLKGHRHGLVRKLLRLCVN